MKIENKSNSNTLVYNTLFFDALYKSESELFNKKSANSKIMNNQKSINNFNKDDIKHINKKQLISYFKGYKPVFDSWNDLYLSGWCKVEHEDLDSLTIRRFYVDCFDIKSRKINLSVDCMNINLQGLFIDYNVDKETLSDGDENSITDYKKYYLVNKILKFVNSLRDRYKNNDYLRALSNDVLKEIIDDFLC